MDMSTEEKIEELEARIEFYKGKLKTTHDQVEKGKWDGKINAAMKEIKELKEKKFTPKVKIRIEDPVIAEKKTKSNTYDSRGSVINVGGTYNFML